MQVFFILFKIKDKKQLYKKTATLVEIFILNDIYINYSKPQASYSALMNLFS
jgi:hypothetical protein